MTGEEILSVELSYFEERRDHLPAEHEGKYALISGRALVDTFDTHEAACERAESPMDLFSQANLALVDTFDTHEAAYERGLSRFGNVPFLIK